MLTRRGAKGLEPHVEQFQEPRFLSAPTLAATERQGWQAPGTPIPPP